MDLPADWPWFVGVALAIALALIALGGWLGGWRSASRQRTRNRVAQSGEREAEAILRAQGYAVSSRQTVGRWQMVIDEEAVTVAVRADLIVTRKGRRYVAEVKTGALAPDPTLPATRRQLLEYSMVFEVDGVLLVDVAERLVYSVSFPAART